MSKRQELAEPVIVGKLNYDLWFQTIARIISEMHGVEVTVRRKTAEKTK